MNKRSPYISFVATTRNDNHGGDLLSRTKMFVQGLLDQCKKHQLAAELILVEWNPPQGVSLLKEILPLPKKDDYLSIHFVIVPPSVHAALNHSDKMPLFQMIAKNVGIRRAKGQFVCCTNIDLLFSNDLFKFLASKQLEEGTFYRANRCDVPKQIDYTLSTENLLLYCKKNILQRLGKSSIFPNIRDTSSYIYRSRILGKLADYSHQIRQKNKPSSENLFYRLDSDACGDFTLMSQKDWLEIQGYLELEAYSIHLDSLALVCAFALGKKQHILPATACTYHVSHEDGWELGDPIKKIYKDIERPMLTWNTLNKVGIHLIKEKKILNLNKQHWGFANDDFESYEFLPK